MNTSFSTALALSAWFGILCAVSPCPLATNIAALGFIARNVRSPLRTLLAGLAYAVGRAAAYVAVMVALVSGLASAPGLSQSLQKHMGMATGPLLIVVGLVLLDFIPLKLPGGGVGSGTASRLGRSGIPGTLALGVLFALALCPSSAALYFGGLMPLAAEHQSAVALPLVFGIASAIPVVACAATVVFSVRNVSRLYDSIAKVERWIRLATGWCFLAAGAWMSLRLF